MAKPIRERHDAMPYFKDMVKKSWTYARLTESEREWLWNVFGNRAMDIKGTFYQRYDAYNAMYSAYLAGVGYHDPINWRRGNEEEGK